MTMATVSLDPVTQDPAVAATTTPGGVAQAVCNLADAIGEEPTRIRVRDPRWATYLKEGCVVRLHVGRWRAVTTLTHADLGLTPQDDEERRAWERVLLLGRRLLLPRAVVDRAEADLARAGRAAAAYGEQGAA